MKRIGKAGWARSLVRVQCACPSQLANAVVQQQVVAMRLMPAWAGPGAASRTSATNIGRSPAQRMQLMGFHTRCSTPGTLCVGPTTHSASARTACSQLSRLVLCRIARASSRLCSPARCSRPRCAAAAGMWQASAGGRVCIAAHAAAPAGEPYSAYAQAAAGDPALPGQGNRLPGVHPGREASRQARRASSVARPPALPARALLARAAEWLDLLSTAARTSDSALLRNVWFEGA